MTDDSGRARDFGRVVRSNHPTVTIRQKSWMLAAFALLVAVGGWLVFRQPAEPEYQGKPLRYWFREYCASGSWMVWDASRHEETGAALCQMGTNAAPYLLDQVLNSRPSAPIRAGLYRLLNTLPRSWGLPTLVSPDVAGNEGVMALKEIKPPASQLLPRLERHLKPSTPFERRQALLILGTTGDGAEQAVSWLCVALKSSDPWERVLAAVAPVDRAQSPSRRTGAYRGPEGTRRPQPPGPFGGVHTGGNRQCGRSSPAARAGVV